MGDSIEREEAKQLYTNSTRTTGGLFGQYTDAEGNKYGPNDMCIENGRIYILDTAKKSVVITKASEVEKVYDLLEMGIQPYMIGVENNLVYILDITNKKNSSH